MPHQYFRQGLEHQELWFQIACGHNSYRFRHGSKSRVLDLSDPFAKQKEVYLHLSTVGPVAQQKDNALSACEPVAV